MSNPQVAFGRAVDAIVAELCALTLRLREFDEGMRQHGRRLDALETSTRVKMSRRRDNLPTLSRVDRALLAAIDETVQVGEWFTGGVLLAHARNNPILLAALEACRLTEDARRLGRRLGKFARAGELVSLGRGADGRIYARPE